MKQIKDKGKKSYNCETNSYNQILNKRKPFRGAKSAFYKDFVKMKRNRKFSILV